MLKDLAKCASEARSKITARSRHDYESDALAYEQKAEELRLSRSKFIYSPTGANVGKNSLQHSHVLKMGGDFLGAIKRTPSELLCVKLQLRDFQ